MAESATVESRTKEREQLLEDLRSQVKLLARREKKRLQYELDWLKSLNERTDLDAANGARLDIENVLVLTELDELLGGGSS